MKKSFGASITLSGLIFFFLSGLVFVFNFPKDEILLFSARILWAALVSSAAFLVFRTGKISRWRAVIFIISSVAFLVQFKSIFSHLNQNIFSAPGAGEVPYCHIAMTTGLPGFLHSQYLAFSSGHWMIWGPLTLGFLWLVVTLVLGKGWCSWVCFYGGWDEATKSILRKPLIPFKLSSRARHFQTAFFIFLILISFTYGLPMFCLWFCPFKMTAEFLDTEAKIRLVQTILFAGTGIVFVALLPFLTKKRTFCSLICPFGAWQSFAGKINPYRVTIDKTKCVRCKKCLKVCPLLAISEKPSGEMVISCYCSKCGLCMDACPEEAISLTVSGNLHNEKPKNIWGEIYEPGAFFIFCGFLVAGSFSNLFVPEALLKLARFFFGA